MPQTNQQYYDNEDVWGDYQYVTLKDILDGQMMQTRLNENHYLKNIKRSLLLAYAKDAIREVNKQAASEVLQFQITVPDSLTFAMPQEAVGIVGVWLVRLDRGTGSYTLAPLDIDNTINTSIAYLQDDQGDLLYDDQGQILETDSLNAIDVPYQTYRFSGYYQPTTDASKFSQFGTVTFNKSRGIMAFSSNLAGKDIVIRYVSDGLHASLSETEVRVHKNLRKTIENYIFWQGIVFNRDVPDNAKTRAERDFNTQLHKSKVAMAGFNLNEIARMMRRRSMTL